MNSKDTEIINGFLNNFFKNSNSKNIELEFRFGKIFKNEFKPENNALVFYEICNLLKKYFKYKEIITKEKNWLIKNENGNGNLKLKETEDEKILKSPVRMYNLYEYDIKISVEKELKLSETEFEMYKNKSNSNVVEKTKNRMSFDINGILTIDLTKVEYKGTTENESKLEYHIEIEVKLSVDFKKSCLAVHKYINLILQFKGKNYFVIPNSEKNKIKQNYFDLTKTKFFIGAQPETLHYEHVQLLKKKQFLITDKADGNRVLGYVNNNILYIFDSDCNSIMKTNVIYTKKEGESLSGSIIDAELIEKDNCYHILLFDILFYKGKDLRGKIDYLLPERLKLLENFIIENDLYKINKKLYTSNYNMGIDILMSDYNSLGYKKDGIIFVPKDEVYPLKRKWDTLLKWKPDTKNTIDFWIVENEVRQKQDFKEYYLYVNEIEEKVLKTKLFLPENKNKNENEYEEIVGELNNRIVSDIKEITFKTRIYNNEIDKYTNQNYFSKSVVEFYWSDKEVRFIPLKIRWDKMNNKFKKGNNINVAKDIWKSIKNPVKLSSITGIENQNQNGYFKNMTNFHNSIKNKLYNKEIKVIELCSGKGGDINRWISNGVEYIVGFDISEKSVSECKNRVSKTNKLQFAFHTIDLTSIDCINKMDLLLDNDFDCLNCHFAINYLFKNKQGIDNFKNICKNYLKKEGKVIITFLDEKKVKQFMENQKNNVKYKLLNNDLIYYLEINKEKINIYLNGNKKSEEYLFDFEKFEMEMKDDDFFLLEYKNFSEIMNETKMEDYEKEISELYSFAIFSKTNSKLNFDRLDAKTEILTFNKIDAIINQNCIIEYDDFYLYKLNNEKDVEFVLNLTDYVEDINTLKDYFKIINLNSELALSVESYESYFDSFINEKVILQINQEEKIVQYLYINKDLTINVNNNFTKNLKQLLYIMKESEMKEIEKIEN